MACIEFTPQNRQPVTKLSLTGLGGLRTFGLGAISGKSGSGSYLGAAWFNMCDSEPIVNRSRPEPRAEMQVQTMSDCRGRNHISPFSNSKQVAQEQTRKQINSERHQTHVSSAILNLQQQAEHHEVGQCMSPVVQADCFRTKRQTDSPLKGASMRGAGLGASRNFFIASFT